MNAPLPNNGNNLTISINLDKVEKIIRIITGISALISGLVASVIFVNEKAPNLKSRIARKIDSAVRPSPTPEQLYVFSHVVQEGETMLGIACNRGMKFDDIKALNPQTKDPNLIQPYTMLNVLGNRQDLIAAAKVTKAPKPAKTKEEIKPEQEPIASHDKTFMHMVEEGETLLGLALKHRMTYSQALKLNPHINDPNQILYGVTMVKLKKRA
jgi:LysM repeat protein